MSDDQISLHEIRIFEAVRRTTDWLTAKEIAVAADVKDRTARHHAQYLAGAGVFEVAKVFGGYRYRASPHMTASALDYIDRLERAKRVFGS